MQNQLLIDDACVSANAEKQHMHKHLFVLEAASTLARRCSILNMHSGIKDQMLLCSPVGKTLRLISYVCCHPQSALYVLMKGDTTVGTHMKHQPDCRREEQCWLGSSA